MNKLVSVSLVCAALATVGAITTEARSWQQKTETPSEASSETQAAPGKAAEHAHDHEAGHTHGDEKVPDHIHGDIVYGSPDAPVEVIEYVSMTCPHCKTFNDTVVPFLLEELIPSGKVKLVLRNFVRDRADLAVAVLSRCTTDVEHSKRLIKAYFERQNEWTRASNPGIAIQSIASSNGVAFDTLQKCLESRELAEHMVEMRQMGIRLYEINSVPTILINGTKVQFSNFEQLKDKIELALIGK